MKAIDIFTGLDDFIRYADGVLPDTTYEQLGPSIRAVTLNIMDLVTSEVYIKLCAVKEDDVLLYQGREFLKSAVATGTLYKYAIFATVKRNGSESSLYKSSSTTSMRTGKPWTACCPGWTPMPEM